MLNSGMFSTCSYNIVNYGPLAAEIGSGVWGTPANFNGLRVLASLLERRFGDILCPVFQRARAVGYVFQTFLNSH